MSWEIAWKFETQQPQTLVSATWSIEGPAATAPYLGTSVLLYRSDGKSEYVKAELRHSQPVSMIQWRPLMKNYSTRDADHSFRHVLLTCCLDGTVRLWIEIDYGRVRKTGKDIIDNESMDWSFCVSAVIEVNQVLNGHLGTDIFFTWASEIDVAGTNQHFPTKGYWNYSKGSCEWLIGFGPGMSVTFWAVHCLDDTTPLRFPRLTLWKRKELLDREVRIEDHFLINKVVILRNQCFGPPLTCSMIQMLPCNSLCLSRMYTQPSSNLEGGSSDKSITEKSLPYSIRGVLNIDGHTGKIMKVALHPYNCEVEVAVSLDSNGSLLFWLLSTISNSMLPLAALNPTWKLVGKTSTKASSPRYTSLRWAPSVLDDYHVLLLGHTGGIDCFLFKISESEEVKLKCHKLCTISFTDHNYGADPVDVFSIPLPSTCKKTFNSNKFLLFAVWMKGFKALSWEITLHSLDLSGSCTECGFDTRTTVEQSEWIFQSTFSGRLYCLIANPGSSKLPKPAIHDLVTSFAIVIPRFMLSVQRNCDSANDLCHCNSSHHMVTGCSDGSLKFWRSKYAKPSTPDLPWELVGMSACCHGPISLISLTECGQKISTISTSGPSKTVSSLCIWGSVSLAHAGSLILEGTLPLYEKVIALNWFSMGNGLSLLGVCMHNELRIYAQMTSGGPSTSELGKSVVVNTWCCIAATHTFPDICDFLWGSRASVVVIHEKYFCLCSQLLLKGITHEDMLSPVFTEFDKFHSKGPSSENSSGHCRSPVKISTKSFNLSGDLFVEKNQPKVELSEGGFWSMIKVAEKLCGTLPIYHPEALLMNIYSGSWKRAVVALKHLVEWQTSINGSNKDNCSGKVNEVIPQIHLSSYFEGCLSTSTRDTGFQWGGDDSSIPSSSQSYNWGSNNGLMPSSTVSELSGFVETIEMMYDLKAINNTVKMQILGIIDLLSEISNPNSGSAYNSLDEPGRRFWVAVRFQQKYFQQKNGRSAVGEELVIGSELTGWAFHSDCQENLFVSLLPNEPAWQEMRSMGAGFWFTNETQLRAKMEKLARLQYLKNRDPKACALLYIALNRLQVLAGLFKMSKDEKDKPLVAFLSRNFQEEKNKAAALKNAYVLMGRHQLELAIAFFLLGGDTTSAITVCAKNLKDEQLALVICRLVEGNGGTLERHLISKFLLPSAIEKGDYWLASLLEWALGNYLRSFLCMLGLEMDFAFNESTISSNHAAFLDPSIGQYCLLLTTKNSMRNATGERHTSILGRWAILMTATALNRSGFPLEALECLSTSQTVHGVSEHGSESVLDSYKSPLEIFKPSTSDFPNWLSSDVAAHMECHAKIDLAMQYISKLLREHPSWSYSEEYETHLYEMLVEKFLHKFNTGLSAFNQKFSLIPTDMVNMVFYLLYNNGLVSVGYQILQNFSQNQLIDKIQIVDISLSYPIHAKQLLKATEEICFLLSRFIVACGITSSQLNTYSTNEDSSRCFAALGFYLQDVILLLDSLRANLHVFSFNLFAVDLFEYYVYFASAWLQRNYKALILVVQPLLIIYADEHTSYSMANVKQLLPQIRVLVSSRLSLDDVNQMKLGQGGNAQSSIPIDERWQIIGAFLWQQVSSFMKIKLNSGFENVIPKEMRTTSVILVSLLETTSSHMFSYVAKELATFLHQKVNHKMAVPTLDWLKESSQPRPRGINNIDLVDNDTELSGFEILWDICAERKIISEILKQESIHFSNDINQKFCKEWSDMYKDNMAEPETNTCHEESSAIGGSRQKDSTIMAKVTSSFQNPKEVYKNNGELFEALCVNSIDQRQAAVASNKKGIIFVKCEDGQPFRYETEEYIWAHADWPQNGWAGSTSTPIPTYVSLGIGLGTKRGAHLGLGGATIGARPGRDLTGGGAFGVPGYAGIGASGLGWGVQEELEEFVDAPATVENIRTRSFSSHPLRPVFLVGSSNTLIYLWEFAKDKATATYGVLPAANVPPPYALASISALQFDHFGHRFASAALDGTVCAWQLEVGGRSNICPTESSLCFNGHASDVTYVTGSGSIIAAAGYSSTGVNVVIWDTLAPPTTSRASIVCHEGGALSLSVFDNDIGSGSISPLIVTGGKGGDVGLHDFRYIATGKTRRQISAAMTAGIQSEFSDKLGNQDHNGMLWYIPKAHSGSVTKISTIPNTSLFLTGSKDGDVKLWDAKRAMLLFHWSKLHDRHTFLQPSSRGFGGVVRAAVTDIQVISNGFLTCGGDGSVKLIQLKDF